MVVSRTALLAGTVLACVAVPAVAQELKIGVASEATSIDPHFHNVGQNNALRRHIFESLVFVDAAQKPYPGLAASWKAVDDTTWEFKLRPGVKFSNGQDFTARDVVYSVCRIPTVENSPSNFTIATKGIESMETPDPLTLVVKTKGPYPLMPLDMGVFGIISAQASGAGADLKFKKGGCEGLGTPPKSADFNDPAKAVGTGPYKLAEYTRGTRLALERNDGYWGAKPHWKTVVFRPITSAGPRVAALVSGDVDMIENPPIQDFDLIKKAGLTIVQGLSNRIIYVHLDQFTGPDWKTPGVKGTDGKNPFLDKRVRQAMSKAINRDAIVDRIMGGVAKPAGELLPVPLFGTSEDRKPEKYDPEGAKKLLAEAGYPNGFELTLGSPNDRYINDEKVAQAVAQMFTRVGIKTGVDSMTASTFFSRRNKYEFSAYLAGWGADTGEMSNSIVALIATQDAAPGFGNTNRGRYSNKTVDELTRKALTTIDDKEREKLLQEASKVGMEDYGIIPLHFEVTPWAFRKTITYTPRVDQYTLAYEVKPGQ
ncbi:peptide ABC transporter substrate-binding protein [Alsobacter metallidurans]|uniref:Peptide ABC transporter substrate-binding protein n=1 Tax=Alsobacter metallidurans TaxID=340221 RepID=A0A917MIV8_9HYPH|nr:ABC transporter substrate-binding protein [Alsobacter metallidurans]GGH13555.1 peptide ABC transporter substrate-binding protein [Alsobacter metallidurans]